MVTYETPRPTRTNGVWSVTGDVARKWSGSIPTLRPEANARHHRFLNLVLRHSGVFVGRQYATFAGTTHGQKVHDFIARVPCAIKLLKAPKGEASFYDFDEFERLVKAAQSDSLTQLLVLLGGEAGLRCGEMMALE